MSGPTTASSRSVAVAHSWASPPIHSPRLPPASEPPSLSEPLHVSTTTNPSSSTRSDGDSEDGMDEDGSFQRMDSQGGSSAREDSPDRGSSDTETKNLLDDGFSEGDAQSLADSEDPYQMTPEQRTYYTEHFKTLLQATGRKVDTTEGAIRGSDDKVKEFFQKSSLSQESLCKIWQLADVNQDGWLNLEEFSVAMHLIVLHVKGNLLIPDFLPPHIAPRVTPPRDQPSQPRWTNFGEGGDSRSTGGSSLDGDPVAASPHSRMFTAQPPNVEKPIPTHRRPSGSPDNSSGGARDYADGPVRPLHTTYGNAPTPPRRRAAPPPKEGPVPSATKAKTASLPLSPPAALTASAPKGPPPKPPPRPPHKSHGRSASLDLSKGGLPGVPAAAAAVVAGTTESGPQPPSDPLPPPPLRDVQTQTSRGSVDESDVGWSRERHSPPPMMDLDEGATAAEAKDSARDEDSYQARVQKLRSANAELEKERARLAQLRLQLELKLQNLNS